jgi:hypothetical protein
MCTKERKNAACNEKKEHRKKEQIIMKESETENTAV